MIDVTVPEIMKKLYSFNMQGFMHAPMTAKLITELILDGASKTLDIEQFSIERFRTGKLIPSTRLI
jgi:glycine/D-amino acid oxidase-like deaminating enzyme